MQTPKTKGLSNAIKRLKEVYEKGNKHNDVFESEQFTVSKYNAFFSQGNFGKLKEDSFTEFLHFKNNHHWTMMDFQAKNLTQDMGKLRSALTKLLDDSLPIEKRIDEMPRVKGMGHGIYSPILLVGSNLRYGVWNSKSEFFLKDYGLMPDFRGKSEGEKYKAVNEVLLKLANGIGKDLWVLDGLFHFHMFLPEIPKEKERRKKLWDGLSFDAEGRVDNNELKDKQIKSGQRGIKAPKIKGLDERVVLSIMVTGTRYSDEIGETGLIYHYPETKIAQQDENEISAMISAMNYGIPIFVIIGSRKDGSRRIVKLGLVKDYDNQSKTFLVNFIEDFPKDLTIISGVSKKKFHLKEKSENSKTTKVKSRPNQTDFRFDVMKRYGPKCAVCDLTLDPTLQAAHVYPKSEDGSDHEENGIVMCANHHRIFDSYFFTIMPDLTLTFKPKMTKKDLLITHDDIKHLTNFPHIRALEARYKLFLKANNVKKSK